MSLFINFESEEDRKLERIEVHLLREILEVLKHIDWVVSYPRLTSFQVQFQERIMPTPGPITLTAAGQTTTAVIVNPLDQFGQPFVDPITPTWSDDNAAAATTDPTTGVVTAVANGTDNTTAPVTNSLGVAITGSGQVIVDIPVAVPVLTSFEVQFA